MFRTRASVASTTIIANNQENVMQQRADIAKGEDGRRGPLSRQSARSVLGDVRNKLNDQNAGVTKKPLMRETNKAAVVPVRADRKLVSANLSLATVNIQSSTTAAQADGLVRRPLRPQQRAENAADKAIAKKPLLRSKTISSVPLPKAAVKPPVPQSAAPLPAPAPLKHTSPDDPQQVTADNTIIKAAGSYSTAMIPDIDSADEENPLFVTAYVNDIYEYLRLLEQQQSIRENFLENREITSRMRAILVDWLVQVHVRFHLLPETLFMTVMLIDRFIQEVAIPKEKLQLLGVTAMFVASKYEEMFAPEIGDFVYITDNSCTTSDIRKMECLLLQTLNFKLGRPLPIHFLRRYSKAAGADTMKHTLAKYFIELAIVHYGICHYHPSLLAAASLWLSLKLQEAEFIWNDILIHYTKYSENDLVPVIRRLCRAILKTHLHESKQQATRNKYGTSKFMQISAHQCIDLKVVERLAGL